MEHNDIRHKLSEYLDNDLTPQEKDELEAHLKTCAECSTALAELQKTVAHINAVEEIAPPAWMTQKIMAKVRAEAEKKQNILHRFFFPLSIKLPIQAVAVVFLCVTAFYIYQSIHPTAKYVEAPMQELAADKAAPPAALAKSETSGASRQLKKEAPDAMKDEAAAPRARDEMALKSSAAPAPAKPMEQFASAKKEMSQEQPAAAPPTLGKADMQERNAAEGAAPQAEAKRAAAPAQKAKTPIRFEKTILERHADGTPNVVATYEVIHSRRVLRAEERFNPAGERHGIQKEYYASGQLKTEARYGQGKLEQYVEYGLDGVKKIGKSDYDWLWLKN